MVNDIGSEGKPVTWWRAPGANRETPPAGPPHRDDQWHRQELTRDPASCSSCSSTRLHVELNKSAKAVTCAIPSRTRLLGELLDPDDVDDPRVARAALRGHTALARPLTRHLRHRRAAALCEVSLAPAANLAGHHRGRDGVGIQALGMGMSKTCRRNSLLTVLIYLNASLTESMAFYLLARRAPACTAAGAAAA